MGKRALNLPSKEGEASYSNSSTVLQIPGKRPRISSTKPSSSQFKGVVPQQNGHCGAQIYANHQRIWLGTFKSEEEAAMAYDSAAIKLRSGDSHRNFPWTAESVEEPNFQSMFGQDAVLGMIKDGSYRPKFVNYLRARCERNKTRPMMDPAADLDGGGLLCRLLFQKELTPSDVGKLNRLVVPKKYAVKYFPRISGNDEGTRVETGVIDDVQLVFYDDLMRMWKFRYCYWSSSQSFVFTRGWNRFVKEKALRANDTVNFYHCECLDSTKERPVFCMIDVHRNSGVRSIDLNPKGAEQTEVESRVGGDASAGKGCKEILESRPVNPTETNNGFKLFGVQIS